MPKIAPPQSIIQSEPKREREVALPRTLELGLCLDKSSSMHPHQAQVIGGYNALVDEQRTLPGQVRTTLVEFGNVGELVYDNIPIGNLPVLNTELYAPAGSTALLDGLGLVMAQIGQRFDTAGQPNKSRVLIAILSDGLENASVKHHLAEIAGEINFRRLEDDWQFVFLAAGEVAAAYALKLTIPKTHIINFLAEDIEQKLLLLSRAVRQYRLGDRNYLRLMGMK
jgi:hypothetical protein